MADPRPDTTIEAKAIEIAYSRRPPHLADKTPQQNWRIGAEEWRMWMRDLAMQEIADGR